MSQVHDARDAGIVARLAAQRVGQPAQVHLAQPIEPTPAPAEWQVPAGRDLLPQGSGVGTIAVSPTIRSTEDVPFQVQRIVKDADREISRANWESALDSTLLAQALAPGYLPLYVRQAELLQATSRVEPALAVARAGLRLTEISGDLGSHIDFTRVLTHADPSPANIVHLGRMVLDAGRVDLVSDYVPAAVDALAAEGDIDEALQLTTRWHELQPEHPGALFLLVRELCRTKQIERAAELLSDESLVRRDPRLAAARLALLANANDEQQWTLGTRLNQALRGRQIDAASVRDALEQFAQLFPLCGALRVHLGRVELEAGHVGPAQSLLLAGGPLDERAAYVALLGGARAALGVGNFPAASSALLRAAELHGSPKLVGFTGNQALFRPPDDIASIGRDVAAQLLAHGGTAEATALLAKLVEVIPNDSSLAKRYGEALGQSGQRETALRVLERVLAQQERERDNDGVLQTLRSLVQLAPGNVRLRNRLVEVLMKQGKLSDVIAERVALAQLLERAGHLEEAIIQLRQAVTVAKMTNDARMVEKLLLLTVRIRPSDLDLRHSAVTTFIEIGQIDQAVRQLWDIVGICEAAHESDEAIAALHQIIALAPSDVEAYHRLGEILASVGEFTQAERVYRRLVVLLPDEPAVRAKQSALAALAKEQR